MHVLRFGVLLFPIVFWVNQLSAQQFGGNPPWIKWKQINTDTVRVIFPAQLEQQARDVSLLVHELSRKSQATIGNTLRKVDVVLQNQTTVSNGYAALAPFRTEFFLTPRQNSFELGSLPWHKTLALHEYRHIQQFNNFRKGISKLFYILFGEAGQSLANSTAIPDWFWEGDAVYQETLLSNQGRGQLPYFHNDYRSLWAAGKNYSWMKLRNGSYRDFVPDHYRLGYMLVAYGRQRYGDDLWKMVTDDAVRFKGLTYPFQRAIKKATGKPFPAFRDDAFRHFRKQLSQNESDQAAAYARSQKHFAADEEFPQWVDSQRLVFIKSSYKRIPAFYTVHPATGVENKIATRNISIDTYFSHANGQLVYAAYRPDPRWRWKNYGEIVILDLASRKQKTITRRSRYFSPDISADGSMVAAVHVDTDGSNRIHVLDAGNGSIERIVPNPHGYVYTYPKFYKHDSIVSAVRNSTGEMALMIIHPMTGSARAITPFSMRVIGFPQVRNDTISFTMSAPEQDKLYAFFNEQLYLFSPQAKNLSTGNYQLSILNGQYAWSAFTAAGQHLMTGPGAFNRIDSALFSAPYSVPAKPAINLITQTNTRSDSVSKYSTAFRLINIHSWRPFISDPEYTYSLTSENVLNTFQSELFFTYNRNEQFKQTGASLAFGGLFPVIRGSASYTFDRSFVDSANITRWNEFNANLSLNVPLRFVTGSFSQNLGITTGFNTQQVYYTGASKDMFDNKRFNYGEFALSASNQQTMARQHIYPRFAQTFLARYRSILNKYTANQLLLNAAVYLPGVFENHSIVLQAAYQRRDTLRQYNFSNGFPFSRGYQDFDFPRMWRVGANYHFPLLYPDKGFGNIFYLLRLRANIFYDYSRVRSLRTGLEFPFPTVGCELYFDSRWWNQLPLSLGFRYSRLLKADEAGLGPNQFEFVLPVTLLSR